jgi:hypothetical protein
MSTESYVRSIETFRTTLKLYDLQLHDIERDILQTPIKEDNRIFLLTISKWRIEVEVAQIYEAIKCLENDFFITRGIHYEW